MRFKKTVLAAVAVIITLIICEMALRLLGYRPGVFRNLSGFEPVDSLVLYKNYTTDEAGIYKFSPWVTDSLPKYMNLQTGEIENPVVKKNLRHSDRIEEVCLQFLELSTGTMSPSLKARFMRWKDKEDWQTEFVKTYSAIKAKATHDEWEQALLAYVNHPFNHEGFRSIEFKRQATKRKRVLIIGDSFVYGMSAKPFCNSFTDILLARGYLVYSAGIPGTDPSQYAAIAKKYAPLIQPDLVVFCFFTGNDKMNFYRPSKAGEPHEYMTNAGFFESSPLGQFLSLEEAYRFYYSLIQIPPTGTLNKWCAKTCITSLLWNVLYKNGCVQQKAIKQSTHMQQLWADSSVAVTQKYIDEAIATCKGYHIPCRYVLIPDRFYNQTAGQNWFTVDTLSGNAIFSGSANYSFPKNLNDKDYAANNDTHFNNSGSLKFANFLDTLIQQQAIDTTFQKTN